MTRLLKTSLTCNTHVCMWSELMSALSSRFIPRFSSLLFFHTSLLVSPWRRDFFLIRYTAAPAQLPCFSIFFLSRQNSPLSMPDLSFNYRLILNSHFLKRISYSSLVYLLIFSSASICQTPRPY